MPLTKSKRIRALIASAGGPAAIQRASLATPSPIKSERTPYKWAALGVPEKHWSLLRGLCGATPDELHAMNEELRDGCRQP